MQFLYPSFLWALLALLIPIIIHLFHFRRFKKVAFTNVRFLKEIKEETSSRNKLKNLLILLMRCLALAALVFAFAQPYLAEDKLDKSLNKSVSIFVDNSSSMDAKVDHVPLLEVAKLKAKELVNAYDDNDRFQILTHDFEGRHQRLVDKQDALQLIEEIESTKDVKHVSNILNRQNQQFTEGDNIAYLISDFQQSITDVSNITDTSTQTVFIPLQNISQQNISVDSAYFSSPVPMLNQVNNLIVEVTNHGLEDVEGVKVNLEWDNQTRPIGILDIPSEATVTDTVALNILKVGQQKAIVKIEDFPVQFDDELFLVFDVDENINVLAINQGTKNDFLDAVFQGIPYFSVENQDIGQIQFQSFSDYDLILLNDLRVLSSGLRNELLQYIKNGGKVAVFPSGDIDQDSYNSFLSAVRLGTISDVVNEDQRVAHINTQEFIFNNVYEGIQSNTTLPSSNKNYKLKALSSEVLLRYENNDPFLTKKVVDNGTIYFCSSPLSKDHNSLVSNAEIFVPMIYKMALSKVVADPLFYTIGSDDLIFVPKYDQTDKPYTIKGKEEFIPAISNYGNRTAIDVVDQIKNSGFFSLEKDGKKLKEVAFNYNRLESNLKIIQPAQLADKTKLLPNITVLENGVNISLSEIVSEKEYGKVLWRWFIWAALFFLFVEMILIRLIKN